MCAVSCHKIATFDTLPDSSSDEDSDVLKDTEEELLESHDFLPPYDPDVEPEATPEEAQEFRQRLAEQEDLRTKLTKRLNCEDEVSSW